MGERKIRERNDMVEIKLPTYGLTERIRQTLVDYHAKILEIGKKVGYPETIAHEQHKNGIYTKETSKCIPLFLNEEYEPFQYPEDLSCTCSESIYCKLYNPINIFWRDCSKIDHVPLEEQLIIYNRAYAIALHALNTVIRPNEYLDGYISFALKQNYILHICIMGVVYCLLSHEQRTPYTNILLDDIKKILQDDFPEIIEFAIARSQPPAAGEKRKRGPKTDTLFNDAVTTESRAKEFKEHCKDFSTTKVDTTKDNPINKAIKQKLKEWFNPKYDPNGRAVYRFLHDDCKLEFKLNGEDIGKQWGGWFRTFWHGD